VHLLVWTKEIALRLLNQVCLVVKTNARSNFLNAGGGQLLQGGFDVVIEAIARAAKGKEKVRSRGKRGRRTFI